MEKPNIEMIANKVSLSGLDKPVMAPTLVQL
jgi:hypothetical protein